MLIVERCFSLYYLQINQSISNIQDVELEVPNRSAALPR